MLAYAEKLTVNPSGLTRADLEGLKNHFSERETLDIVMVACVFNFMDRVADALGVEMDQMLVDLVKQAPEGEAFPDSAAQVRT